MYVPSLSFIAPFVEESADERIRSTYSSSIKNKKPTFNECTYSYLVSLQDSTLSENVSNNTSRKPGWNLSNEQSDPLLPLQPMEETKKLEVRVKESNRKLMSIRCWRFTRRMVNWLEKLSEVIKVSSLLWIV